MALWGGRFTQAADQRFKQFNDSLRFDYRLAEQDIVGSVAWSKALVTVGVLTADEQLQLEEALNNLLEEVRANPQQILQSDAEDIHSWVEGKLIDKVGQLGKKLHTGRSRNDQVATDLKLWCKDTVIELLSANRQLQTALVILRRLRHDQAGEGRQIPRRSDAGLRCQEGRRRHPGAKPEPVGRRGEESGGRAGATEGRQDHRFRRKGKFDQVSRSQPFSSLPCPGMPCIDPARDMDRAIVPHRFQVWASMARRRKGRHCVGRVEPTRACGQVHLLHGFQR